MLLKNYDEIVNKFNIYRKAIRNLTKEKDKESPNKELEELDSHFKKEVAELRNIMVDNQKNITHMNDVIAENKKEIETLTKSKYFVIKTTKNWKKSLMTVKLVMEKSWLIWRRWMPIWWLKKEKFNKENFIFLKKMRKSINNFKWWKREKNIFKKWCSKKTRKSKTCLKKPIV